MEEIGARIVHPVFIHQALPVRFCEVPPPMAKKRDLPGSNPNCQQQQQQQQQRQKNDWNPKFWEWDSVKFIAKQSETEEVVGMGTGVRVAEHEQQKKKGQEALKPLAAVKQNPVDDDNDNLVLKLGGSAYSVEEPVSRPNKRVRSGSPSRGNYPMCQVDDCGGDLSNAKDYHRRHKVCEIHSKTTKALVGKQLQRFCQQCSRFHPLSEFDEGKRSCRRRLAGHNRRRRKTQPEEVSALSLRPGNGENAGAKCFDIVNLLAILAHLQGNNLDKNINGAQAPDRDRLLQILSKMDTSSLSANYASRLPARDGIDLNISQVPPEQLNKLKGNISTPSTSDLLAVLSAAVTASSPDARAVLSERGNHCSVADKTKPNFLEQGIGYDLLKKISPGFTGAEKCNIQCTVDAPQVQDAPKALPLQLFGSSTEDDSPPKLASPGKYFSSDSSNPMDERSPSSSPPVEKKLFPLQAAAEIMKHESFSISGEDNGIAEACTGHGGWGSPLELFRRPNGRVENGVFRNSTCRAGYTSSSGSDHSPSSSNSDAQDQTGRIIFKLFDKDPGDLPASLRTEVLNWLSHSPSEMESYIRPGCVFLSIYASMPSSAWEQLQEHLLRRVKSLVQDSKSDFWRSGRFLLQTDKQLALHNDGKVRLHKSWRTWATPEILSVSPLAVVGGKGSVVLRGRKLSTPGTMIYCTSMGRYICKEIKGSVDVADDGGSLEKIDFPIVAQCAFGRCFIEVENGLKGNSFPVIVADADICGELRHLEAELEEAGRCSASSGEQMPDFRQPKSSEDIKHFLHELGWLFQRKSSPLRPDGPVFSIVRFKFLLTFSVERDWCALVKTLLDIFVENHLGKNGLSTESLEMLSEIHLLNRAVKRKCRRMVDLLIQYCLTSSSDGLKKYIFFPNQVGPGGITPLHLAACSHDSEDIVDALTNDPQEAGLNCWNSLLDGSGQSAYSYAVMRNNPSYNKLVAQKIADKRNGQLSISVEREISLDESSSSLVSVGGARRSGGQLMGRLQSCSRCSVVMNRHYKRMPGAQGLLHRPYVHSMLAIAAVCVCVCLFLRGSPDIGRVAPFKWENLHFGTM